MASTASGFLGGVQPVSAQGEAPAAEVLAGSSEVLSYLLPGYMVSLAGLASPGRDTATGARCTGLPVNGTFPKLYALALMSEALPRRSSCTQ